MSEKSCYSRMEAKGIQASGFYLVFGLSIQTFQALKASLKEGVFFAYKIKQTKKQHNNHTKCLWIICA